MDSVPGLRRHAVEQYAQAPRIAVEHVSGKARLVLKHPLHLLLPLQGGQGDGAAHLDPQAAHRVAAPLDGQAQVPALIQEALPGEGLAAVQQHLQKHALVLPGIPVRPEAQAGVLALPLAALVQFPGHLCDLPGQLVVVHGLDDEGHVDIRQHDVRLQFPGPFNAHQAVVGLPADATAAGFPGQGVFQRLAGVKLVVHQQDIIHFELPPGIDRCYGSSARSG